MKADVSSATLAAGPAELAKLELLAGDLRAVGRIAALALVAGDELALTDVVLAPVAEQ